MKYGEYNPLFPWPKNSEGRSLQTWEVAKEIDDHFYDSEVNYDRMFSLMYSFIYKVTCKRPNFFKDLRDYDKFATFLAENMFIRYRKSITDPKLPRIKSYKNYINEILNRQRVTYQSLAFPQVWGTEGSKPFDEESYTNQVIQTMQGNNKEKCLNYLKDLNSSLYYAINNCIPNPEAQNPLLKRNIGLSALVTIKRFMSRHGSLKWAQDTEDVVLWHLDEQYRDIVLSVTNKVLLWLQDNLREVISKLSITEDDLYLHRLSALDVLKELSNEDK